jgi:hypothetical protein
MGSRFKIDASYLSPNVNVAMTLESSTKAYGSKYIIKIFYLFYLTILELILISNEMYQILSAPM